MLIENERTFLLKFIPSDLKNYPKEEYLDIYIPKKHNHPNLRIRKRGSQYEITKKFPVRLGDASKQHEFTIPISKDEFNELEKNLQGKYLKKQRYYYKYNDIPVEIDIFKENLRGLALADFEFTSESDKIDFREPNFCLAEVTQENIIAGGRLAGKKYEQIKHILNKYDYKPLFID